MSGENILLWGLVDGDATPFELPSITVHSCATVGHLKKWIKEKKALHDVNASSLEVWQVRIF